MPPERIEPAIPVSERTLGSARICNSYCFSTTAINTRLHLDVTLYVYWLSCDRVRVNDVAMVARNNMLSRNSRKVFMPSSISLTGTLPINAVNGNLEKVRVPFVDIAASKSVYISWFTYPVKLCSQFFPQRLKRVRVYRQWTIYRNHS